MDINIEAICWPDYDRPAMHTITVVGKAEDGRLLCTLECLRWAKACFDITRVDNLSAVFDEHSAFAYGLTEDVRKRRRAMIGRHGQDKPFVSGFIGIIVIRTEPKAAGNRHGLELIRYLKKMHTGMLGMQGYRPRLTTWSTAAPRISTCDDGLLPTTPLTRC